MKFVFDGRPPESPLIEMIWQTQSEGSGSFISTAGTNMEIVFTRQVRGMWVTVRGPETLASNAAIPEDADFFGIRFKLGTFLTNFSANELVNNGINLPETGGSKSFWLNGSAWQFPSYDNADVFVNRLIREGLLMHDEIVAGVLQNQPQYASIRTVRRRFLRATGLTHKDIQQIERAQKAAELLQRGTPILDAVDALGYFDQAHMTNSLKRFMGQTPTQILRVNAPTAV
jgi:AraC-like DNA-binding protein